HARDPQEKPQELDLLRGPLADEQFSGQAAADPRKRGQMGSTERHLRDILPTNRPLLIPAALFLGPAAEAFLGCVGGKNPGFEKVPRHPHGGKDWRVAPFLVRQAVQMTMGQVVVANTVEEVLAGKLGGDVRGSEGQSDVVPRELEYGLYQLRRQALDEGQRH
ncbi:hypothetical protein CV015_17170, partial [Staphylococcus haemolyticus]